MLKQIEKSRSFTIGRDYSIAANYHSIQKPQSLTTGRDYSTTANLNNKLAEGNMLKVVSSTAETRLVV